MSCLTNFAAAAEDESELFTVTFVDFDGNVMLETKVAADEPIDYSLPDTSVLKKNIDKYTQIAFLEWDRSDKYATGDITIQALSQQASIQLVSPPSRTEFYSKNGKVSLDGLRVTITIISQTNTFGSDGERLTTEKVVDIEQSCTSVPSRLSDAFSKSGKSAVTVYPPGSKVPLLTYDISLFEDLGDANMDNEVNSSDASFILYYYAMSSTGNAPEISHEVFYYADVDQSGSIDSTDASKVLLYYALHATGANPDWEQLIYNNT